MASKRKLLEEIPEYKKIKNAKTLVDYYQKLAEEISQNDYEYNYRNFMKLNGVVDSEMVVFSSGENKKFPILDKKKIMNFVKDRNILGSFLIVSKNNLSVKGESHAVVLRRIKVGDNCMYYDSNGHPDNLSKYGWGYSKFYKQNKIIPMNHIVENVEKLKKDGLIGDQNQVWKEQLGDKFHNEIYRMNPINGQDIEDICFGLCLCYIISNGEFKNVEKIFYNLN